MALGATVMYFLDPDHGARRRALLRDKAISAARKTRDGAATLGCDLQNRAIGAASEVRGLLDRSPADDRVIEARVRAELGRTASHPGAIETFSTHGCVTLSGPILASEHGVLMRAISHVRGVHEVIDELEIHESSAGVPALQGGSLRPGQRWVRGSPTTQLVAGLAVAGALAYARGRASH
jgi:hypothetical protein